MATKTCTIAFPEMRTPQEPAGYFFQMADFGEDLSRDLERAGLGELETDVDAFFREIIVRLSKNRHQAAVLALIKKRLKQHHLFESAVIRLG